MHFCFTRGLCMVARARARGKPLAWDIDGGSTVASAEVRLRHAKATLREQSRLAGGGGSVPGGAGSFRDRGGSSDSLATARAVTPNGRELTIVGRDGGGGGARASGSAHTQHVLGDALLALEAAQEALNVSNESVLKAEVRMHHDITVVVVVVIVLIL